MNPSGQSFIESNLNNGKGNSTSILLNAHVKNGSQTVVSDDEVEEDLVRLAFLNFTIYLNSFIAIAHQIIRTLMDKKNESGELQQMANKFSDLSLLTDEIMPNIEEIQNHLQNDIDAKEKLLDEHCDEISRDFDMLSPIRLTPSNESCTKKNSRSLTKLTTFSSQIENKHKKRPPIDPQKKSKLLAALKSIDSSSERV